MPRAANDLPPLEDVFWSAIDAGLAEIPFDLSVAVRAALDAQARLLLAWNSAINLTALRSADAIARGHVLDSLLAMPPLRELAGSGASVLDLGSGAGYPGIPVALALPARRVALVDSVRKKAAFLEAATNAAAEAMRAADLAPPEFMTLSERAEDLADEPDQRESWDLVLARAVGSIAEVAELGLPLVRLGGHLVMWKRDGGDGALGREIASAASLVGALGGRSPRVVTLAAAARLDLAGHCLVVVGKQRHTPLRFPRSAGERRRAALP